MKNLLLVKMQAVLETLAAEGTVSLNTLSERLNIPLPTLSRLVSDMVEMKLVEKIDYYRIAPASGLIRMGECARKHSYLVQTAAPILQEFAEKMKMNLLFGAFDNRTMFRLFEYGNAAASSRIFWETGLALVLMERAGCSECECSEFFRSSNPGYSETDLLIFEREMEYVKHNHNLLRTNTMRQWGCSQGMIYRDLVCGFCFYGLAPENCSRDRFDLDCTMLLSKITSALKEE
ncbi:MAG: winged helix-turn-helix transcriptional regulator [Lentisphaerae bacterium]|nr:winged helix-turn-helix transcriptional regulator [Lentisphaerota bacterium]